MSPVPWTVSAPVPVRINGEPSFYANVIDANGQLVAVGVDYANAIEIASAVNTVELPHLEKQTPKGEQP